jgi:regulator of protease activity HflC (stomatin/prohibitin superfamily)
MIRKIVNTGIGLCNTGEVVILQRFGEFKEIIKPGIFVAIPFIDKLSRVDTRETSIVISPQSSVTRDNVAVKINGTLYVKIDDPYKAKFCAKDPIDSTIQHAFSSMRACIGDMHLDQVFHDRKTINEKITNSITDAASAWGVKVLRYEISNVITDETVRKAMDLQAVAERNRREKIKNAEGDKEKMIIESEGRMIEAENNAKAIIINANADAEATYISFATKAKGIKILLDSGIDQNDILNALYGYEKIDAMKSIANAGNIVYAPTPDIAGILAMSSHNKK